MFKDWVELWRSKGHKKPRAVPAIEIDTDLANAQYENQNEIENMKQQAIIGGHLEEEEEDQNMIRIEGDEEGSSGKEEEEESEGVEKN